MLKIFISPTEGIVCDTASQFCEFGILEGAGALIAGITGDVAGGIAGLGVGTATSGAIASGLVDATIGAGLGSAESAITGGDPGLGALTGGLTGGAIGGFGGIVGDTLGIGTTAADALVGAGAGALGSAVTGGNPLTGALGGAGSGLVTGMIDGGTTPGGASATGTTSPGPSAASLAPVGGGALTDLTAGSGDIGTIQPTDAFGGNIGTIQPTDAFGGNIGGAGASTIGGATTNLTAGFDGSAAGNIGTIQPSVGGLTSGIDGSVSIVGGGSGGSGGGSGGESGGGSGSGSAGQPSTIDTAINNPTSGNILKALGANAGPLVAGAGLAANLASNNSNLTGLKELESEAGALSTEGSQLSSYLTSGQLPPGAQAGLTQATNAAQAAIRSKYASLGMSGSTAETQELNNVTLQEQAEKFQISDSLLKTGLDATNTSAQIYGQLLNFDQQQSKDTGSAIASLAQALAGTSVIKLSG